jgi:hypothetical protein
MDMKHCKKTYSISKQQTFRAVWTMKVNKSKKKTIKDKIFNKVYLTADEVGGGGKRHGYLSHEQINCQFKARKRSCT